MNIQILSIDTSYPHHIKFNITFDNGRSYTETYEANPYIISKFERSYRRRPGKAYAAIKKSKQISSVRGRSPVFETRKYILESQ